MPANAADAVNSLPDAPDDVALPSSAALQTTLGAVEPGLMLASRYGPQYAPVMMDEALRRQVLLLAQIHCTYDEISAVTEVAVTALHAHCRPLIELGRQRGRASLRRKQYLKAVEDGSVPMLVWLGKNLLGQADRAVLDQPGTGNSNVNLGGAVDDADPLAEAQQVMDQLRARLDSIRHNRERGTARVAEASASGPGAVPQREEPAQLVSPPPPRTQREEHQRAGYMRRGRQPEFTPSPPRTPSRR